MIGLAMGSQLVHSEAVERSVGQRYVVVRPAAQKDLPAITDIYNHAVWHTDGTFEQIPWDSIAADAWFRGIRAPDPVLVATFDGELVGYATYTEFRRKSGYAVTRESSIYVAPHARHCGVGSALYQNLIVHAHQHAICNLIAVVTTRNHASQALHRRFGFERVGVLPEVGQKHGRWLSAEFWQLRLAPTASPLA